MAHSAALLDEFRGLAIPDRLTLVEAVLQLTRKDLLQGERATPDSTGIREQMAAAAQALLSDYVEDEELTAFTALDGDGPDRHGVRPGVVPSC